MAKCLRLAQPTHRTRPYRPVGRTLRAVEGLSTRLWASSGAATVAGRACSYRDCGCLSDYSAAVLSGGVGSASVGAGSARDLPGIPRRGLEVSTGAATVAGRACSYRDCGCLRVYSAAVLSGGVGSASVGAGSARQHWGIPPARLLRHPASWPRSQAEPAPMGDAVSLPQQIVHRDDLLGHLNQFLLAAHGLAAHQRVGLFFVAAAHLHQHALGQFDALAFD